MKLVIGGAYQGKRRFAEEKYPDCDIADDFHLTILEMVKSGISPVEYLKDNCDAYNQTVVVCDDISSGVVPVDALSRKWREETGRALQLIAENADEVFRVFCGIGVKIK